MGSYWARHRLLFTIMLAIIVAVMDSLLFVFPVISHQANTYNNSSIYKNTKIDFNVPEPSFTQVDELAGTNGINEVFPYYLTKMPVNICGGSRTTTILLSDRLDNVEFSMYNSQRLIEEATEKWTDYALIDWQFAHDTSAKIGDTISFTIDGELKEFQIYAIYETNTLYENGAILINMSEGLKEKIASNSKNNGYSGMYVSASDYAACRNYLLSDYRPLGRLKSPEQFDDENQYKIHYDAIMSSGYANEITDLKMKRDSINQSSNTYLVFIGSILAVLLVIGFNFVMSRRGCEKNYFKKYCVPKGKKVDSYYYFSAVFEIVLITVIYSVSLLCRYYMTSIYIPKGFIDYKLLVLPIVIVCTEIVCLVINRLMVNGIVKQYEIEKKLKSQSNERKQQSEDDSRENKSSE